MAVRSVDDGTSEPTRDLSSARVPFDDDATLVEDRDLVGELFGLVEVLGGEQHRGAPAGEFLDGLPHLDAALRGRARSSARRGR